MEYENLKIIETHTHTCGVSFCSRVSPSELPVILKEKGIGTFLVTNHYSRSQMSAYEKSFRKQIEKFINEYKEVKAAADKIGSVALLGAEVAISTAASPYTEFILYGITEEFLKNSEPLYNLSQSKLFDLCDKNNILMYQAHPFRTEQGHSPADPEFMHGVEINKHMNFLSNAEKVCAFADKYNLGVSCGSDIHYHSQAGTAGIYAPVQIDDSVKLAGFLKANKRPKIYMR